MSTALTTKEPQGLMSAEDESLFAPETSMEGVGKISIPFISIIAQAQMFKFPDESKRESFSAFILEKRNTNTYWLKKMGEGENTEPDCSSKDGITPEPASPKVQAKSCYECPRNVFKKDGSGKECKNKKLLFVWVEGEKIPKILTVPVTSVRACDEYFASLYDKGRAFRAVKTKFTLKEAFSRDGIAYSEIELAEEETLKKDDERLVEIAKQIRTFVK